MHNWRVDSAASRKWWLRFKVFPWHSNGSRTIVFHGSKDYTMDIGSYGCLAIAPQGFLIGQKFATGQSSEQQGVRGTWVRRGQEGSSGWELGLQLQKPAPEFWEIGL